MKLVVVRDGNPHRMLTLAVWSEVLREAARLGAEVLATPADPPVDPAAAGLAPAAVHPLPVGASPDDVAGVLRRLGATAVVSLSDPDPPRLRDARAADLVLGRPPEAPGSCAMVGRAMHKGLTRDVCAGLGIPLPRGTWLRRPAELERLPAAWGPGLVVKEVDGWGGAGMAFHDSHEAALADVHGRRGPVVVEELATGEEVSVDVVAGAGGCLVAGWVLKGPAGAGPHPLFRLRYIPRLPPPREIAEVAVRAVRGLRLDQLVEVELVVDRGAACRLLEVNPRASGVTALVRAANGIGSPVLAMRAALGVRPALERPPRCACELSVPWERWPAVVRAAGGMATLAHLHPTATNRFLPRCYLVADRHEELARDVRRLSAICGARYDEELETRALAAERLAAGAGLPADARAGERRHAGRRAKA